MLGAVSATFALRLPEELLATDLVALEDAYGLHVLRVVVPQLVTPGR